MTNLVAAGSIVSDVAALVTAVTGLIAGVLAFWKYLDERRKRKEAEQRERELENEIESVTKDPQSLKTKVQKVREFVLTMDRPISAGEISKGAGVKPPVFWILKDLVGQGLLEKQGDPRRPRYSKKL